MNKSVLSIAIALTAISAQAQSQLNIICSVQADWCNKVGAAYERTSGTKVNITLKGSGDAVRQLMTEKDDPKVDLWFGGTGDPHLQAAEDGLTLEYKSPNLSKLRKWAREQARRSNYKTVGIYSGALGFAYNVDLLELKNLPAPKTWADLLKPAYQGEILMANPASSGTAYTMVATLVQLMGEDQAFEYMKQLHKNINQYTRTGTGPIKAVARGEALVSISFVQDGPGEKMDGYPVATITPAEGTGAEIGSMSIVKGARNASAAKKFYEWALTPAAQGIALSAKQFQLPSNKIINKDPRIPDFKTMKFVKYDYVKYGSSAERKRLIAKWEKEVNSLPH